MRKVSFVDADGRTVIVEVTDEYAEAHERMEREERNADRRYRYHNPVSLDALEYEGEAFRSEDETPVEYAERMEGEERCDAFRATLTPTQLRRLWLFYEGLSEKKVAEREGVCLRSVQETREQLRRKYRLFFWKEGGKRNG